MIISVKAWSLLIPMLYVLRLSALAQPMDTLRLRSLAQFAEQSSLYPSWRISLSSNDHTLAYVVTVPVSDHSASRQELRLRDLQTRQTRKICCENANAVNPSWSPDGTHLAFVQTGVDRAADTAKLMVVDLSSSDHTPKRFGGDIALNTSSYPVVGNWPVWLNRSTVLVLRANCGSPHSRPQESESLAREYDSPGEGIPSQEIAGPIRTDFDNYPLRCIDSVDISTGARRPIICRVRIAWPQLSPDRRFLAYAEYQYTATSELISRYHIHVLDLHSLVDVVLAQDAILWTANERVFSWRNDSRALAFPTLDQLSSRGTTTYHVVSGANWRNDLSLDPQPGMIHARVALWSRDRAQLTASFGNRLVSWNVMTGHLTHTMGVTGQINQVADSLGPDGRLVLVVRSDSEDDLAILDYSPDRNTLNTIATLPEEPMYQWGQAVLTTDLRHILYPAWSLNRFVEIETIDWGGHREILTDGDNRPRSMYARYQKVAWTTARGERLEGGLLLPSPESRRDNSRLWPLIVRVYPVPHNVTGPGRFGLYGGMDAHSEELLLVASGYAVFFPNCPTRPDSFVSDLGDDVSSGVQHLANIGLVDPHRLGLIGQSDGVEAALNLLTQTHQFGAAVLTDGFSNFLTEFADISGYGAQTVEGGVHQMKPPWEDPSAYVAYSPVFHLDRITAPILLFHGTADQEVPLYAGQETFANLRILGKRVRLVQYPKGGHSMSEWTLSQQVDAMSRTIDWFDHYLNAVPLERHQLNAASTP